MSAEFFEVEAPCNVIRPQAKVGAQRSDYATIARPDIAGDFDRSLRMRRSAKHAGASTGRHEGAMNDEAAPCDEPPQFVSAISCGVTKLVEICVASSIHTMVWVVLLVWIDLVYYSYIFSGQNILSTTCAFAFIWISTFMCFYALVEDEDRCDG